MRRRPFLLGLTLIIGAAIGISGNPFLYAQQTPKPISDNKDIAGKWWGIAQGGYSVPITLIIKGDGTYEVLGSRIVTGGTFEVRDGKARFKNNLGNTGTFTLYDDKSGPILRSERDDGTSSGEYRPVK